MSMDFMPLCSVGRRVLCVLILRKFGIFDGGFLSSSLDWTGCWFFLAGYLLLILSAIGPSSSDAKMCPPICMMGRKNICFLRNRMMFHMLKCVLCESLHCLSV
jgi:hypothetical protein